MVQIEECQNEEEEARARLAEIMGRNERLSVQLDLLRSHGRDRS